MVEFNLINIAAMLVLLLCLLRFPMGTGGYVFILVQCFKKRYGNKEGKAAATRYLNQQMQVLYALVLGHIASGRGNPKLRDTIFIFGFKILTNATLTAFLYYSRSPSLLFYMGVFVTLGKVIETWIGAMMFIHATECQWDSITD